MSDLTRALCDLAHLSRETIARADLNEPAAAVAELCGPDVEGFALVAEASKAAAEVALQFSGADPPRQSSSRPL